MRDFDVAVIGAGPAGSTVAYELARAGWSVLLAEEHHKVGNPVQCAGLVSHRVLEMAGTQKMVTHRLGGASIWSPSMKRLQFQAGETRAYVLSREELDFLLAERAAKAGAEVESGWRFDGLERAPGGASGGFVLEFKTFEGQTRVKVKLLVGADGVSSTVARSLRLRRPIEILPAYETEIPFGDADPEEVEIYTGSAIAPGFFGWSVPDGTGNIRVGVAMKARRGMVALDGYRNLIRIMEKRYGRPLPRPIGMIVSGIPVGMVPRTSTDGGLLVGDAAAQVKPLSGGGIFTGMRCAQILGGVASQALSQGDLSGARLGEYDRLWKDELGQEFDRALFFRRLFVKLSDTDLDRLIGILGERKLLSTIVAFGDIDFPTLTARELLRQSPSLLRLFPKALSALLRLKEGLAPSLDL